MNPILNNQFPALSNSDNFLVIELLRIVNSLPEGLGWALWLFSLLRHCAVMVFLNILIKHFNISTIYRVLDSVKYKALNLLKLFGYKSMIYEVDFSRLYNPSEEEMENYNWHQRLLQFFGYDTLNHGNIYNTYYTKYNSRRILAKVPNFVNGGAFYLPCFLVTLSHPPENKMILKVTLMFYYRNDAIIEQIERIHSNLDLLPPNDCASFVSINFNNNVCTPKTVISNPLIPIKNYQKLSDIICRYTKIQNSLGYKNINAISIDGMPGLGKTSFMDYFSHNHRNDYQIIYIDMIKNYKTKFDDIYNNLLRIIESSVNVTGNDMKNGVAMTNNIYNMNMNMNMNMNINEGKNQYDKGIVIMMDEIDKYIDMHIEFLHSIQKETDNSGKGESDTNKNKGETYDGPAKIPDFVNDPHYKKASQTPIMGDLNTLPLLHCEICGKEGKTIIKCPMCSVHMHAPNSQRGSICSMLFDNNIYCIPCGTREMEYRESISDSAEQMSGVGDEGIPDLISASGCNYRDTTRNGYTPHQYKLEPYFRGEQLISGGPSPADFNTSFKMLGIKQNTGNDVEEYIPKSVKYFKKEILYRLLDLINQKVKQPTYLIFCTNNFTSMWDDLNQKHFNHLKALKSRFIQIHFTRLDKPNLIDILRDINETFQKKLPEKYVVLDEFTALTEKIPEDFQLTIRELHHLLIRSMYDLVQFTDLLVSEHLNTVPDQSEPSEPSELAHLHTNHGKEYKSLEHVTGCSSKLEKVGITTRFNRRNKMNKGSKFL